jgi:hypothetical protein
VSAIAHWLEQHGISTVVVGLVRLHLEKMQPPRALWVPFELGRPLGAPGNRAQQKQVLLSALQLIETATSRIIQDYEHDDTRARPDPAWQPPTAADNPSSVAAEMAGLQPHYETFVAAQGRTSVGVAKIPIAQCAELIDHVLTNGTAGASPRQGISNVLMLRLALDDIKACYHEAALSQSDGSAPSSRQLNDWFWLETYLGTQLRQVREQLLESEDKKLAGLAARFMIPHRWRLSA